ncbi:hypothetical protein [Streptomyces sp. NPDC088923]|uniref:hypothetical protein n=1 Tax=Streptomyces sp. NPDC088923 TaxID=3365913 RepID=UPI00381AA99C
MTYSADKVLGDLTTRERAAVESIRAALEEDPVPGRARRLPDADPRSQSYGVDLLPEQTGRRGITLVYRHDPQLDAILVLWLIVGP